LNFYKKKLKSRAKKLVGLKHDILRLKFSNISKDQAVRLGRPFAFSN
jgi:hypothetical protein